MSDPIVDIIIPTFGRADRLERVAQDAHDGTPEPHIVTFVVEADDELSVKAAGELEGPQVRRIINDRAHNYAGAVNAAILDPVAPLVFAGADDLHFHSGWLTTAMAYLDGWVMVVGTNDLFNLYVTTGLHATHYLIDIRYVTLIGGTIDQGPGIAIYEGYDHQWTDTEFIGVAKARCRFRPCLESIVEHMHYGCGKAEFDATYERDILHLEEDRVLYAARKQAWDHLVV